MPDAVALARLEGDLMGKVMALATDPKDRLARYWQASGGRSWRATREFYRSARDAEKHSPGFKYLRHSID